MTASTSDTSIDKNDTYPGTLKPVIESNAVALKFLARYSENREKLTALQIVNHASGESFDSTKFYSINFKETEKHLNTIKETGFVSPAFMQDWEKHFLKADKQFKVIPKNDGPPENFEFDLILYSQEVDDDLNNIGKTKVASKTIRADTALVILKLPSGQKLKFKMSMASKKWLTDRIEKPAGMSYTQQSYCQ